MRLDVTVGDASNGYEAVASQYIAGRGTRFSPGAAEVRAWARGLQPGGAVLDLGCGPGAPISQALVDDGFAVYGVNASPSMIAAFRARFPGAPSECSSVEASRLFDRTFDAVVAWGLLFLLTAEAQALVIGKVASALRPGGRFLFTAPRHACEWPDTQTGQTSRSLGVDAYRALLEAHGLALVGEEDDEGCNHYYSVRRT